MNRKVLVPLITLLVILGMLPFLRKKTSERPVYTLAAQRLWDGEEIYRPDEPKPFTYPPFFALPFVPLAVLPQVLHRPIWYLANLAALFFVLRWLWRLLPRKERSAEGSRGPPTWVFAVALALLAGRHVAAVFENQSHDLLVLLLVTACAYTYGKRRAGLFAGTAAACKATPLLFVPVFLWQRKFAAAGISLLCLALLLFLPDLVTPRADGGSWTVAWYQSFLGKLEGTGPAQAEGAWAPWNHLNQNLAGTIYRLSTPAGELIESRPGIRDVNLWTPSTRGLGIVTLLAQLFVLGLLFVSTWSRNGNVGKSGRTRTEEEQRFWQLGTVGLVACAMVLLSPMSSKSHFCVLLLASAFCLWEQLYRRPDRVVLGLLVLSFVSGTLTTKGIVGSRLGNLFLSVGTVTWSSIFLLLACAHILFRHDGDGRSRSGGD